MHIYRNSSRTDARHDSEPDVLRLLILDMADSIIHRFANSPYCNVVDVVRVFDDVCNKSAQSFDFPGAMRCSAPGAIAFAGAAYNTNMPPQWVLEYSLM